MPENDELPAIASLKTTSVILRFEKGSGCHLHEFPSFAASCAHSPMISTYPLPKRLTEITRDTFHEHLLEKCVNVAHIGWSDGETGGSISASIRVPLRSGHCQTWSGE
ncbi:unnamed protein product [Hydatigera taeniaeformis]|uniref:Uncharacterized protein n=1 Tax=Hydatigena taeniaeformis TaxID=6205 RepID=A0A0R3WSF9_HYDTA|nr:unnamed protein product [Hydatigera taeniaeformis]